MSTVQVLTTPASAPTNQTHLLSLKHSVNSPSSRGHCDSLPLLRGHSDIHIREGIMNALRAVSEGASDAEKAFMVADLSRVYQQHLRWQRCLPGIRPFYGRYLNAFLSLLDVA
jgi:hypothetical protein